MSTDHDAAPAARAPEPEPSAARRRPAGGTGEAQEPVAWAVMSGRRAYGVYSTRGEAEAICRWLCEDESGDIWRVVPLAPEQADAEIARLRDAIRRLADHDATLSVCDGNVTVEMDATLTAEERVAVELAAGDCLYHQDPGGRAQWIRQQLLGILERTGGGNG